MKRNMLNIEEIKKKIISLKGEMVEINVNRGRRKIESVSGIIKDIYPSVFTIAIKENKQPIQTFSYYDVLCGNVVFMSKSLTKKIAD